MFIATKKPTGGRFYLSLIQLLLSSLRVNFANCDTTFSLLRAYPDQFTLISTSQLGRVFRSRKFGKSRISRLLSRVTFLSLLHLRQRFYSIVNYNIAQIGEKVKVRLK